MKSFKFVIIIAVALVLSALGFMSCSSKKAKLVSITITPVNADNVIASDIQLTATGTFSDGLALNYTTEVTWSSSDPTVATVGVTAGLTGFVTVLATTTGATTTITAYEPNANLSSSILLTIATPRTITITPGNPFMVKGISHQFDAIATFGSPLKMGATFTQSILSSPSLTWNSSDLSIATVYKGLVSTVATALTNTTTSVTIIASDPRFSVVSQGTTTLTVTPSVVTSITVTAPLLNLVSGATQSYTAIGHYPVNTIADQILTSSVYWTSSATTTVTVFSNGTGSEGQATAVGAGQAFIIATDPISKVTGSAMVIVN